MQKPKHLSDKPKRTRPPVNWGGLSSEPRNENLARMQGPGSYEKGEEERDKKSGPSFLYRFKNKDKGRDSKD
ncbi:MAG: hypothetical protein KJP19_02000 [Deltaproteobacteria bacterium]|nr:hypothetical protein [Deltaproteobacteria bacterium]NNK57652.1 hypothetical protein [Desulfofustis sp.]